MRPEEYSLSFQGIQRCRDAHAYLAMRERIFLYGLVYSLAPRHVLEIGTFKGGSAYIISGALDDLALGGKLLTIDPFPEQIDLDWTLIAHNAQSVKGFFPADIDKVRLPGGARYDLAFVDGDHSYAAVSGDLRALCSLLNDESYVLLHDAFNDQVARAIREAVTEGCYLDCGRVGRVFNDTLPPELYGGFHLLYYHPAS
jgi:predicted O-methyltransferase YrrM